ncbi:MAG: asparagine synthase C-terminal domain-containing protein, partial [Pseudomonadota bacterium]|nr:asparagine synthase C-terminal domain-containing protein [Pseudomonadota bacterium]
AAAGGTLGRIPPGFWNGAADLARRRSRQPHFGAKVQKALWVMGHARSIDQLHDSFMDEWHGQTRPVLDRAEAPLPTPELDPGAPDAVRMMYRDALTYMPDDVLCKVDRAAMAVSLETRVPLLDHRVAEVAARLPLEMKISGGVGKQALRKLLYRHVPAKLLERPKAGFGGPTGDWLRGPLRGWAEELLHERRLRDGGYFDPGAIRRRWQEHLGGRRDWAQALWSILMFQAWSAQPDATISDHRALAAE